MHFGMMRELSVGQKFAGVVISPNAKQLISPMDRELMEQYGAAVVECSWVRIKEVPWAKIGGKCERLCKCPSSSGFRRSLTCNSTLSGGRKCY